MTFEQLVKHFAASEKGMAKCPSHEDHTASLSIGRGTDGRTLLHCFAGCTSKQIAASAGLTLSDLFSEETRGRQSCRATAQQCNTQIGCTLTAYAEAKRLPIERLRAWGVSDFKFMSQPVVRIEYRDVDGSEAAVRFRTALRNDPDGGERFVWRRGSKVMLYGLDRLELARKAGYIVIVEGESDCHVCWLHDVPAVGLPGAETWRNEWSAHFQGIPTIYVVIEPDKGGEAVLEKLSRSPLRERVRLVRLAGYKDVAELHASDPDRFLPEWAAALDHAESYNSYADLAAKARGAEAWSRCQALAHQPDILRCLDESLAGLGVVGEQRAARLVYLATVSRFFGRPTSVAVKGPSSGGKSFVTEQVLRHFPPSAYYALTGMSDRVLAYSEEPLQHRMLVLYEAAGMSGDFATYLIRSLLSEGQIRYEVVEKTRDGLRPRLIQRDGPTGLITTTTAVMLHPENETRLLSIPVTDTRDQTKQILLAQSEDRDAESVDDLTEWHALQEWLSTAEHRVSVPFGRALAELIPAVAVRQRRDVATLWSLIKAHAMLHQATRDRDPKGRIVAALEDYAAVRELVADLFEVAVQATVSETTRTTVQAVERLAREMPAGVSIGMVAKALCLDKSTASRRVAVAVEEGYLENREMGRGKPAKLVIGDPLPDAMALLPNPADLIDRCSDAASKEGMAPPLSGADLSGKPTDARAVY